VKDDNKIILPVSLVWFIMEIRFGILGKNSSITLKINNKNLKK
jgi:hypothetical protein